MTKTLKTRLELWGCLKAFVIRPSVEELLQCRDATLLKNERGRIFDDILSSESQWVIDISPTEQMFHLLKVSVKEKAWSSMRRGRLQCRAGRASKEERTRVRWYLGDEDFEERRNWLGCIFKNVILYSLNSEICRIFVITDRGNIFSLYRKK